MSERSLLKIGDPIEVLFVIFDNGTAKEFWVSATVCVPEANMGTIGAAMADGTRKMLRPGNWRPA
jgi:hypothetical protein